MGIVRTVLVLVLLGFVRDRALAAAALAVAGMAWIAVLTSANTAAQMALPNRVRGRGLAIYLTVFYGAMTAGSFVWGQLADAFDVRIALLAAAGVGALSLLVAWLRPMPEVERDLTPSMHWPEPARQIEADEDGDAVLVTIEYRIDSADRSAFLAAAHALEEVRRRDGAWFWRVFEDAGQPGRMLEVFMESSWAEHRRHHHRVTKADADVQQTVAKFHRGDSPPRVTHYLARPRQVRAA